MPRSRSNAITTPPPGPLGATAEFRKRPLEFMRLNTIVPPSDREMRQFTYQQNGNSMVKYDPGFSVTGDIHTGGTFVSQFSSSKIQDFGRMETGTFKRADVTTPIGFMKLKPHEGYPGAYTFSVKNDPHWSRLPIWFLPWASDRIVQMDIPERPRHHDMDNDPNSPDIFFTAAINGCSVFVTGDSRHPTVAHLGTEASTPYGGEAAEFWRTLFAVSQEQSGGRQDILGEVNNTMYVNDTGISKELHTVNADAYKAFLEKIPGPGIRVKQVQPYGCVFGIRYGRMWSFYLQENVRVTTVRVGKERKTVTVQRGYLKKTLFGMKKKFKEITEEVDVQVEVETVTNRPIRVSPFYPKGDGAHTFTTSFQTV